MARGDEHQCEGRWRRFLRLAVVALFLAWGPAGALHAPALAAASDGVPAVAAHQPDLDATDHDSPGHICAAAQGHCYSPAILCAGFMTGDRPATPGLPRASDMAPLTAVAPVDRPPILSFAA